MVLSDSLTGDEVEALREHLRCCPSCAAEWQRWERLHSLLTHLPSLAALPEEREELRQRLRSLTPAPEWDCATAQQAIWRWVDGDLTPTELTALSIHTANCDRCQRVWWQASQMNRLLRSLPRLTASEAEKEALKARLRQQRQPRLVPFWWRVAVPIAAAAAVILALIGRWWLPTREVTLTRHPQPVPIARSEPAPTKPSEPPAAPSPRIAARPSSTPAPERPPSVPSKSPIPSPQSPQKGEHRLASRPEPQKPSVPPVAAPVPFQQEPVEAAGEPVPSVTLPQEQPSPVVAEMPAVAAPLPPLAPPAPKEGAPAVAEGAVLTPKEEALAAAPLTATVPAEPRQLVALPPVTIEGDLSLQPPRVRLTVVPPSQRLYRRTGVALVTVPPEKRPLVVPEEKALAPDLSIPLAAERYRSHTATIPFLRFGVSW